MCKRRLLEYYKRENVKLEFEDIKDLTEEARGYFKESRRLNSKNIYAYISEIQLIVILIEYGKDGLRMILTDGSCSLVKTNGIRSNMFLCSN